MKVSHAEVPFRERIATIRAGAFALKNAKSAKYDHLRSGSTDLSPVVGADAHRLNHNTSE